jgi:hypothetical protein
LVKITTFDLLARLVIGEELREEFLKQIRIKILQYTQFLVGDTEMLLQARNKIILQVS